MGCRILTAGRNCRVPQYAGQHLDANDVKRLLHNTGFAAGLG